MFDKAMFIAAREHLGVRDKGGHAYILHPMRVAMRLRTNDEELMCIAVLHDVIEDSKMTYEDLYNEGFSERVVGALRRLEHKKNVTYDDYIDDMRDDRDALLVKREDLRDNSDITRLKGVTEKDIARMAKYHRSFLKVEQYLKELDK